MDRLFTPKWISSTGEEQPTGGTLAVGTYYIELRKGRSCEFGVTLIYDANLAATATVEGNDATADVGSAYAAAGTSGWTDEADIDDIAIATSAGASAWHVLDFVRARARVKLVVTTPGVVTLYPTFQGN